MPSKPATITGGLIEASHLNDFISYYNEIWTGSSYTFGATHQSDLVRRLGWGQTASAIIPTPSTTEIVTISHINQGIAQVNAGLYHTEDDPTTGPGVTGLYPLGGPNSLSAGSPIPITLYNDICNKAETLINDKYKVDWSNFSLAELQTTRTTPWQLDLQVVNKFAFSGSGSGATAISGYNEARHFFNSGGELTLELSMAPGGTQGNQVWQRIFDQFDSIRIGAESCRVVSDEIYDVISTSGVNKGFYTGIQSSGAFTTILDAGVFRYQDTGAYAYAYAYVYVYSEYNSRRIRIELAADEDTPNGIFNVYVKVTLIEDADDSFVIDQDITLNSGYVQPSTTPLVTDGNKSFMTEGSTLHQFEERATPTITLDTVNYPAGWKDDEYYTANQLTNWAGTWLTDVSAGNFMTGQAYTIKSINDDIPVTLLITGHAYKIKTVGTTDFTKLGAANNTIGTTFTATDVGTGTGTAGGATSTDTNFTLIGSANSNVNTVFTATGPGTGSGTADEVKDATDDPGPTWNQTPETTDSDFRHINL